MNPSWPAYLLLACMAIAVPPSHGHGASQPPSVPPLKRIAIAIGVDGSAVQRVEASGELRTYVGEELHRHEINVVLEVPSLYRQRRVLTFPPSISVFGFDGQRLIRELNSTSPGVAAGVLPLNPDAERNEFERQRLDATRLWVAWTMSDRAPLPIRYEYKGRADVGQTEAHVFSVVTDDTVIATVYADVGSGLPIGLSFPRIDRGARAGQLTDRGVGRSPSETRWTLGEHKRIAGMLLPHSLVVADDGKVREEWYLRNVRVIRASVTR